MEISVRSPRILSSETYDPGRPPPPPIPETLGVADDPSVWDGADEVMDAGLLLLRQLESPRPIVHSGVLDKQSTSARFPPRNVEYSPSSRADRSSIRHRQQHSCPFPHIHSPRIRRRPTVRNRFDIPDIPTRDQSNDVCWWCVARLPCDVKVGALGGVFGRGVEEEVGQD